jgi:hypothetical protein
MAFNLGLKSLLSKRQSKLRAPMAVRFPHRFCPRVELLEDRCLLSAQAVTAVIISKPSRSIDVSESIVVVAAANLLVGHASTNSAALPGTPLVPGVLGAGTTAQQTPVVPPPGYFDKVTPQGLGGYNLDTAPTLEQPNVGKVGRLDQAPGGTPSSAGTDDLTVHPVLLSQAMTRAATDLYGYVRDVAVSRLSSHAADATV